MRVPTLYWGQNMKIKHQKKNYENMSEQIQSRRESQITKNIFYV